MSYPEKLGECLEDFKYGSGVMDQFRKVSLAVVCHLLWKDLSFEIGRPC